MAVFHYNTEFDLANWADPTLLASWPSAAPIPQENSGSDGTIAENWPTLPREYTLSDLRKLPGTDIYQLTVERNSFIKAVTLKLPALSAGS